MHIKIEQIGRNAGAAWMRWYRLVFFVLLFAACVWGGYIWYNVLYSSTWTDSEKNEYNQSKQNEIKFGESDFNWLLERNRDKVRIVSGELQVINDIFNLGEIAE